MYIAYLNPDGVSFFITPSQSYRVPIVALLFLSLLLGVFLTAVLNSLKEAFGLAVWASKRFGRHRAQKFEKLYKKGARLLEGGDLEGAFAAFEEVLKGDPRHLGALQKSGEIYRAEGNIVKALQLHLKARLLAEGDPDILYQLATDYRLGGQTQEAIKALEEARERDKTSLVPLREMRFLFMDQGDWERAYAVHKDLLLLAKDAKKPLPDDGLTAALLYEVGNLVFGRGEIKKAIASYRASLKASEDFVPAYMAMGKAYLVREKEEDGIRTWEKGYEKTSSPLLLKRLEEHFLEKEQPGRVVQLYWKALKRNPDDFSVNLMAGEAYLRLEILEEALEAFKKAEATFSSWSGFHLFLGRLHEKKGESKVALQELKSAFEHQSFLITPYSCLHCSYTTPKWSGRCPSCQQWGTLQLALLEEAQRPTGKRWVPPMATREELVRATPPTK